MNPRTQVVISVAVIALLGAGVWLGWAREISDRAQNNESLQQKSNVTAIQNLNVSGIISERPPSDEAYWDAYWSDLVQKASLSFVKKTIGTITFSVPESLTEDVLSSGFGYYFNDIPEGPYIQLAVIQEKPINIIEQVKKSLSPYERIVNEGNEIIGGISWLYIQQTTDFGIDQVTWVAENKGLTIRVLYNAVRPEVTEVFESIIRSAKQQ